MPKKEQGRRRELKTYVRLNRRDRDAIARDKVLSK